MYNPNWTLRKCCSKVLDKLSTIFPEIVIDVLQPYLENSMQSPEWIIKERSILVLGAIGVGCYDILKPNLNNLIDYLIKELNHQNKLVKAIACWTISRFTQFLLIDNLSENSDELLKSYLSELLKTMLDKESIVQEAACTAFITAITTKPEKLSPFFFDIIKIITMALEFYKGNSLLTLYDTISILTENYVEQFSNFETIQGLLLLILKKWYGLMNVSSNELINNQANMAIFDVTCSIIKVSGTLMSVYFEDLINSSINLISKNYNDKEITSKCLEIISSLCQGLKEKVRESNHKYKIVDIIFQLLESYNQDSFLKQFLLPLIGDICLVDAKLLQNNIDYFIKILIRDMNLPESSKNGKLEMDVVSLCNNACWTIGLISLSYPEKIKHYVSEIIEKIIKIISLPKLNKSLAQNISICIGRLCFICPDEVSVYLESFIKQFCLSLKSVDDSEEKRQAFQ
jgi:transportin-1